MTGEAAVLSTQPNNIIRRLVESFGLNGLSP